MKNTIYIQMLALFERIREDLISSNIYQVVFNGFNAATGDNFTNALRNIAVLHGNTNVTGGNTTVLNGNTNVTGDNATVHNGNTTVTGDNTTVFNDNTTVTGGNTTNPMLNTNVTNGNTTNTVLNTTDTYDNTTAPGGNCSVTIDALPVRFTHLKGHMGRAPCTLPNPNLPLLCKATSQISFNN